MIEPLKLKIPPPLYAIIFMFMMLILQQYIPIFEWQTFTSKIIAFFFLIIGLIIDVLSMIQFFKHKTTINPFQPQNSKSLVMSGPYSYTRNPMYLGLLCFLFAFASYLSCLSPFLLIPLFINILTTMQIKPEEKALEKQFGSAYLDYKKKVRRWI